MRFLDRYMNEVKDNLMLHYDEDKINKFIPIFEEIVLKRFKEKEVDFVNSYKETSNKMNLSNIIENYLDNKNYSLTGNGCLYNNNNDTFYSFMVKYLMESRNKHKKEMFESLEKSQKFQKGSEEYNKYFEIASYKDLYQKNDKIFSNAFYGLLNKNVSIFYNRINADSVTSTGRIIISTAVNYFEKFFGNLILEDFLHFSRYINSVIESFNSIEDESILDLLRGEVKSYDYLLTFFTDKIEHLTVNESVLLKKFLKDLYESENNEFINFLYYKNNFYEFINLPDIKKIFNRVNPEIFLNLDNLDKKNKNFLSIEKLWNFIDVIVGDYSLDSNRFERTVYKKRKTVLVIDTDSNFLYLDPFSVYLSKLKERELKEDEKIKFLNILVYFLGKYIKKSFGIMLENLNVKDDRKKAVSMKNEFFINRLILTSKKKRYALLLASREGKIFNEPEIDFKGLDFIKSTINSNIKKYYKNFCKDFLFSKDINLSEILKELELFSNKVYREIQEGSLDYSKTERLNPISGYKFPYRITVLRGALVWNYVYPNNQIAFGSKCKVYSCKISSLDDIKDLKISNPKIYGVLEKNVFQNKNLSEYGINTISIPFSEEKLPSWIVPYIDVEKISNDILNLVLPLLESLGISIITIRGNNYYTNLVKNNFLVEV